MPELREGGLDDGGSVVEYVHEERRERGWVYRLLDGLVQIGTLGGDVGVTHWVRSDAIRHAFSAVEIAEAMRPRRRAPLRLPTRGRATLLAMSPWRLQQSSQPPHFGRLHRREILALLRIRSRVVELERAVRVRDQATSAVEHRFGAP